MATTEEVKRYYNEMTASYLDIYGDIIQAYRPNNTEKLLDYIGRSAELNWQLKVLDLGCGVGGPAIHFVNRWNVFIDGVTISEVQLNEGNKKISNAKMTNNIKLHLDDYHNLNAEKIKNNDYDIVLFLESLGHANNIKAAIQQAFLKLKTGGKLYIKDFYKRKADHITEQEKIDKVIQKINDHYAYNTLDLENIKKVLKETGFEIKFIQPFDFMNDITIRSNFETKNNINLFEGQPEFFPADWLEIKCVKTMDKV